MVNRFFIAIALLFLSTANVEALEIEARVDKNPVMLDEALVLTVVATGKVDRNAFDPSPLLTNFVGGNTSVSSQTRIVNFDKTTTTTWQTTLFPKTLGQTVIPPFTVDGASSQPIDIEVIPVPDVSTNETRDYFVVAELKQPSVYVQQHASYTIKLYLAQNIERGSLQAPTIESASIEQVGDDQQYSDIINGKRFQVIERHYVIVPEKSGSITIDPPIFSGEVLVRDSRQRFGLFGQTQTVTRRGPQLVLDVLPIPKEITGSWLPSEYVILSEEWSNNEEFVVGEPITRTLTLSAAGLNKEQLPEISQSYPPNVKSYPDQPSTASAQKEGIVLSQRVESTAIIPSQAGPMVIPGVEVQWFNTVTGQLETALIPPRSYDVMPGTQQPPALLPQTNVVPTNTLEPKTDGNTEKRSDDVLIWQLVSAILALLWLITLFLFIKMRKPTANVSSEHSLPARSNGDITKAIDTGDQGIIYAALLKWLRSNDNVHYTDINHALIQPQNSTIKQALNQFIEHRYGNANNDNAVEELKQAVSDKSKKMKKANKIDKNVEAMYK
jgi:hypothetical protein